MHRLSAHFSDILSQRRVGARLYVALSGGLDSTVLLHLAQAWTRSCAEAPTLEAWHVNHGMQADADSWEAHCVSLCEQWGIPLRCDRVSVNREGRGEESAAREARYGVFEQGVAEGEVLLLGHHLDDQIETFFLRLLRGAGLQGLSAMPAQRALGPGQLLRPLLSIDRVSLQAYAREYALDYIDDPSNADTALDRNFLRHDVLPLIAGRWGGYRQTVSRASDHLASALAALEATLPEPRTIFSAMGDPGLSLVSLMTGTPEIAAAQLRAWLRSRQLPMPDQAVLEEFLRQLADCGEEGAPRLDCGHFSLQRFRDGVYHLPPAPGEIPDRVVLNVSAGSSCHAGGLGVVSVAPSDSVGLVLQEGEELSIARRSGGERCRPQGRSHSQTLKKLYQERAIPPWWRDRIPLVFLGEELLAAGDLWLCESSRLEVNSGSRSPLWQVHWQRNSFVPVD